MYMLALKLGFGFFRRAWPFILVAVIVGGGYWYVTNLQHKNEILELQAVQLKSERDAWKESFGDLKVGLDKQVEILQTVAKQGDKLKNQFKSLTSSVHVRLGVINDNLIAINDKDFSTFTCDQAIDYLRAVAVQRGEPE